MRAPAATNSWGRRVRHHLVRRRGPIPNHLDHVDRVVLRSGGDVAQWVARIDGRLRVAEELLEERRALLQSLGRESRDDPRPERRGNSAAGSRCRRRAWPTSAVRSSVEVVDPRYTPPMIAPSEWADKVNVRRIDVVGGDRHRGSGSGSERVKVIRSAADSRRLSREVSKLVRLMKPRARRIDLPVPARVRWSCC